MTISSVPKCLKNVFAHAIIQWIKLIQPQYCKSPPRTLREIFQCFSLIEFEILQSFKKIILPILELFCIPYDKTNTIMYEMFVIEFPANANFSKPWRFKQ